MLMEQKETKTSTKQPSLTANIQAQYFYGRFKGIARYHHGLGAYLSSFKLATNTHVLSISMFTIHPLIFCALIG